MSIGACRLPSSAALEEGWVGAIFSEQNARDAKSEYRRQERIQVAESQVKPFFALGRLQREILEIARRNEALGERLEHYAHYHHECDVGYAGKYIVS